jgi:hypothetical protein
MSRSKLSQQLAVVDKLDPVSQTPATVTGAAIDMNVHRKVLYIIDLGAITATATIDASITASATSGGSYVLVPGKAVVQVLAAGGNNKVLKLEIASSEMPSGKEFIKLSIVVGTAATLLSYLALADSDRYEPANLYDLAAVTQTIS